MIPQGCLIAAMLTASSTAATTSSSAPNQVDWASDWSEPGWTEVGVSGGLLAAAGGIFLLHPQPPLGFKESVLFDDAIRRVLRADTKATRDTVSHVSDWLQNVMILAPFSDSAVLALRDDVAEGVPWKLALLDLQSSAAALALTALSKSVVGRARPQAPDCPAGSPQSCRSRINRQSFLSGHTTASFNGAGLVCVHRQLLSVYGDELADGLACPAAMLVAATTGILRITADKHYATDVLAGALLGAATGYALPYLLYSDRSQRTPSDGEPLQGSLRLLAATGLLGTEQGPGGALAGARFAAQTLFNLSEPEATLLAAELRVDGLLLRSQRDFGFQQAMLTARMWYGGFAVGFAADYRGRDDDGARRASFTGGPSVALGAWSGRHSAVILSGRWAPLFDGRPGAFGVALELDLFTWFTGRVEVFNFVSTDGSEDAAGEVFLVGLGGRLPW